MRANAVRAVAIALTGMAVGVVAVLLFWRPAPTPLATEDRIERPPPGLLERPPVDSEITFATPEEAARRRRDLRRFAFGRPALPDGLPEVERGIEDHDFTEGLENLARLDRLTIPLPHDFSAVAYHVVPREANGELLIYHGGHREDFRDGKAPIAYFLEHGYAVLAFTMPFAGLNEHPETFETPTCGRVELSFAGHDSLACTARPLRYFLEPVVVGLNYAKTLGYERAGMVGFSGGGWTTVLSAALDPRIERSYSVAGSMPMHVLARTCPGTTPDTVVGCFGDLEQRMPGLYRIANYVELYVLDGWGPGRKHVTINNVYDPVSFEGRLYEEWRPRVAAALRRLGSGSYDAVGDTSHRSHAISPFALRYIASDLERGRSGTSIRTTRRASAK